MNKLIITILLNCSFVFFIKAQIVPPDFLCVKGDTLFWELPVNTCGPFVSYDIYTSDDINGPYTILASVTDPLQTFFYHPNPAGLLQYYYLLSNFNCPGQASISSDTLDSYPPTVSPLQSVTVQGSNVLLSWTPSTSPEVYAYVVYRRDPNGVVPIDTVFDGSNSYMDVNATPEIESEGYLVNALDRCGNTSIFDVEHKTIFLEGVPTNCSVELNWNIYEGWGTGVGEQEVWVETNGSPSVLFEVIGGMDNSFSYQNVNDGDSYCFYIVAKEAMGNNSSQSNKICFTSLGFSQPINELYFTNLNVASDNSVVIDWGVNDDVSIEILEVLKANASLLFEVFLTETPQTRVPQFNQSIDVGNTGMEQLVYQLQVLDSCGNMLNSTNASPVFLTGFSSGVNSSQLNWTPLSIDGATVFEHKIFRVSNTGDLEVGVVGGNDFSFEDQFDQTDVGGGTLCYFIEAVGEVTLPDGAILSITSRSNTFCIDQAIVIHLPNALSPSGFNREFKPVILSGAIAKYKMEIYDRYGSVVFSTNDPDIPWTGKKGATRLPQGVYIHHIQLELENGDKAERKGYVTLLR